MSARTEPQVPIDTELYAGIKSIMRQFEKQKDIICDEECRSNQATQVLYKNYQDWKYLVEEGPTQLRNAEKEYYEADKGMPWYDRFREKQAEKEVAKVIPVISNRTEEKKEEINRNISYYQSQTSYLKRMNDLLKTYSSQFEADVSKINALEGDKNVAQRLATYYNRQRTFVERYVRYISWLYWIIGGIAVIVLSVDSYRKRGDLSKATLSARLATVFLYFGGPWGIRKISRTLQPTRCT